jgi:chemotaxis protein methyltransferase CheR
VQLNPDLIIIEIARAELTAIEIINRLHGLRTSARKHIPVMVISDFPSLEFELLHINDFICKPLNLDRIRESIGTLAGGKIASKPAHHNAGLSPAERQLFQDFLVVKSGLCFDRHNSKLLERGLNKRMATLRINSYRDYYEYLDRNVERRQELQKLLQFLTVGESFFFRQHGHFNALINMVLPAITQDTGRRIRLWSAGCSTGEEPYSMAMAVMEAVPDWKERDVRIVAADINSHSLMRAVEGGYHPWKIRATEKKYLDKYFTRSGENYLVKDEVKALVDFVQMDLLAADPLSHRLLSEHFDVIFCRNVMIYFSTETAKKLTEKLAAVLKPNGYLFLGHAETLAHFSTGFERLCDGGLFYRKKGGTQPAVAAAQPRKVPLQDRPTSGQEPGSVSAHPAAAARPGGLPADSNPGQVDALLGEAITLAHSGRFNESLERCNCALDIDDLQPGSYFIRGFVYDLTGRKTEAIDEYRKAILLKMDFVMPHYQLGLLYSRTGQRGNGRRALNNSLKLLEQMNGNPVIPYSGGVSREAFLEQLRADIVRIDAALAV